MIRMSASHSGALSPYGKPIIQARHAALIYRTLRRALLLRRLDVLAGCAVIDLNLRQVVEVPDGTDVLHHAAALRANGRVWTGFRHAREYVGRGKRPCNSGKPRRAMARVEQPRGLIQRKASVAKIMPSWPCLATPGQGEAVSAGRGRLAEAALLCVKQRPRFTEVGRLTRAAIYSGRAATPSRFEPTAGPNFFGVHLFPRRDPAPISFVL